MRWYPVIKFIDASRAIHSKTIHTRITEDSKDLQDTSGQVRFELFHNNKKTWVFFFFFFLEPCSPTLLSYSVERPNTDNNTVHPGKTEMQLPMESLSVFYKGGWMGSGGRRGKRRNYIVSLWLWNINKCCYKRFISLAYELVLCLFLSDPLLAIPLPTLLSVVESWSQLHLPGFLGN